MVEYCVISEKSEWIVFLGKTLLISKVTETNTSKKEDKLKKKLYLASPYDFQNKLKKLMNLLISLTSNIEVMNL